MLVSIASGLVLRAASASTSACSAVSIPPARPRATFGIRAICSLVRAARFAPWVLNRAWSLSALRPDPARLVSSAAVAASSTACAAERSRADSSMIWVSVPLVASLSGTRDASVTALRAPPSTVTTDSTGSTSPFDSAGNTDSISGADIGSVGGAAGLHAGSAPDGIVPSGSLRMSDCVMTITVNTPCDMNASAATTPAAPSPAATARTDNAHRTHGQAAQRNHPPPPAATHRTAPQSNTSPARSVPSCTRSDSQSNTASPRARPRSAR